MASFQPSSDIYYELNDYLKFGFELEESEGYGFGEETYLYDFCPIKDLELEFFIGHVTVTVSYHSLINLAGMTIRLINAWKKRKETGNDYGDTIFGPHGAHYQLDMIQREELKSYSLRKLEQELGSKEQVLEFEHDVHAVETLLKNCVLAILAPCLPHTRLPYPVWSTMMSYLLEKDGLKKIGQICVDATDKENEAKLMCSLYLKLAEVYDHLKWVMFLLDSYSFSGRKLKYLDSSWDVRRKSLHERSQALADLVHISMVRDNIADIEAVEDQFGQINQ